MKNNVRDMMKLLILIGSVALAACATGRPAPDDTPMATMSDENQLTYLFGMGDKACTITTTGSGVQDLGSPEVMVKVKPFAIDVHEVTIEQYQYCVEMEVCSEPAAYNGPNNVQDYYMTLNGTANSKYANYPVVYVTQNQAREYCEFRSKRLPTEFEWELVAGGAAKTRADKRLYPFLPDEKGPDAKIPAGCDKSVAIGACKGNNADVRPVGSSADDKVTFGGASVYDLAGNVMEWTASDADEAKSSPSAKPISATCDWTGDEPWTCDDCVTCLTTAGTAGGTKCTMCATCVCGTDQQLPADPTATTIRPNCYQPNKTPICPRYPTSTVLDKSFTGKNASTKRVIRGGAYITSTASGLSKSIVDNCFGRSDARVLAKGPQDDPLIFVGFRCAKDVK
jgi:formylglycine-generating enzyme required for sulfatase activity